MITILPLPSKTLGWAINTEKVPREYRSMVDFVARLTILRSSEHENCALSIHAVPPKKIQEINRLYRHKDKPTNVLAISADALDIEVPDEITRNLGDIFICLPIVEAEAKAEEKLFLNHLIHMVVHATLHLTGHDHENNYEAKKMENSERRILSLMGIPDPY
jgi:probable rRNA maturation factor